MRNRLGPFAFLAIALVAGCSGNRQAGPTGTDLTGSIEIDRGYGAAAVRADSGTVAEKIDVSDKRILVTETQTFAGRVTTVNSQAFFTASGYPSGYVSKDSRGNAIAIRFASGRPELIVEDVAGAFRSNRTVNADGSYREVATAFAKGASIVSTTNAAADGSGTRKIEIFPHTGEASSTYYGFLNDAKIQYDFASRPHRGMLALFADGGFAAGYTSLPPLRFAATFPVWFDGSSYRRVRAIQQKAPLPMQCLPHDNSQRAWARAAEERTSSADPLAGTTQDVVTQVFESPDGAVRCIVVVARATLFPQSLPRRGGGLRTIRVEERLAVTPHAPPAISPDAAIALAREQALRIVRVEVARERAAGLRELAASGPPRL